MSEARSIPRTSSLQSAQFAFISSLSNPRTDFRHIQAHHPSYNHRRAVDVMYL